MARSDAERCFNLVPAVDDRLVLLGEATPAITFLLIGLAVAFFYIRITHRLSTLSFSPSSFATLPTGKPLLITRSTASRLKTSGNTRRVLLNRHLPPVSKA